jgi:DNA-directed RNA polymerase beta subunit
METKNLTPPSSPDNLITCRVCAIGKNKNEFYYSKTRNVYLTICIVCDKARKKEEYNNNKIKLIEKAKDWQKNNKEKHKASDKKWRQTNRDKIKEYNKKYKKSDSYKQKRFDTIKKRLDHRFSTAIRKDLQEHLIDKKHKSWKELLGYTVQELINHLEKQFKEGMTWDNYGAYWHIDHIRPKSWFNYSSITEPSFKECWALTNLQPLEARENCSKGNRYEG